MMVRLTIDAQPVEVPEDFTVLRAAKALGITIPTLCYNPHLKPYGGCRICLVEITATAGRGRAGLVPACSYPVQEGLTIETASERVLQVRRFVVELLLASAPDAPEIQELAASFGVSAERPGELDEVGKYLLLRAPKPVHTKCIKCGLCVRVCDEFVGMSATTFVNRGTERKVTTPLGKVSPTCIGCGACAYLCPTRAITIEPAE